MRFRGFLLWAVISLDVTSSLTRTPVGSQQEVSSTAFSSASPPNLNNNRFVEESSVQLGPAAATTHQPVCVCVWVFSTLLLLSEPGGCD